MLPVESAFKIYVDLNGDPLNNGYIWFGQPNQNPVTAPVTVYWDAAGTQPAAQPLRTMNGYIVRNGTPANVFYSSTYSQLVQDKKRRQVYYAPTSDSYSIASVVTTFITNLASYLGASLIGFIQGGVGAILRTVQDELRDRISVKQFGALGDGVTDDAAAIQATFTAAISQGKTVYFPSGTYMCSARITTTGASVAVQGAAVSTTRVVFTAANCGFYFQMDPQTGSTPPDQLSFDGLTIESRAVGSNAALVAEWTARQPNAQGQLWISNVSITRQAGGTGSFTEGIRLRNCVGGWITNVNILGDDARVSNYGMQLESCIEIMCKNLRINRYKECVHINKLFPGDPQTEGIFINDSFLFDCNRGLYSPDAIIHLNLMGTFINPNGAGAVAGIEVVSAAQFTLDGCLIYVGGNPTDPANQDGVRLVGGTGGKIIGTQFAGVTKANARYGVVTSAGSSYNEIVDCSFSFFSGAGTNISTVADTGNRVLNNNFYDSTATILDSGTGTYKINNTNTPALSTPSPINALRFGAATGASTFVQGHVAADSNWGMFLYPYNGAFADLALADSGGTVNAAVETGRFGVKVYAKASLPPAALFANASCAGLICVNDDVGGFTLAFSDGTNWRRVQDRNVIS